jgi:ABC-type transport system substrate-binding protein
MPSAARTPSTAAAGRSRRSANPAWWGDPPKAQTIVIRYIGDSAQAQALQNGEVNIMEPQPQVDIVNQLKALGAAVKVQYGDQYSFEHLDVNYKGEFKNADLRSAFAKCIPRQQIVDNLIGRKPKAAPPVGSSPFQPAYPTSGQRRRERLRQVGHRRPGPPPREGGRADPGQGADRAGGRTRRR